MPSMDFMVFLPETEGPHFRVPFFPRDFACLIFLFLFLFLFVYLFCLFVCLFCVSFFIRLYPAGLAGHRRKRLFLLRFVLLPGRIEMPLWAVLGQSCGSLGRSLGVLGRSRSSPKAVLKPSSGAPGLDLPGALVALFICCGFGVVVGGPFGPACGFRLAWTRG